MGAITSIVLTDGETAPVDRTFVPLAVTGDKASHVNRGAVLVGNQKLHIITKEPKGNELYGKVIMQLVVPTLEVSAGSTASGLQAAPTLAYNNFITVEGKYHKRSTEQERKNMRVMMIDLLATANPVAANDKLEPIY